MSSLPTGTFMTPLQPLSPQDPNSAEFNPNMPHLTVYEGVIFPFFETGTEGLLWALQQNGACGYEGLVCLGEGDLVTIHSPQGELLFEGLIKKDHQTGAIPRYEGDPCSQVTALGYWAHWSQEGWAPDSWAKLFVDECNRGTIRRFETSAPDVATFTGETPPPHRT